MNHPDLHTLMATALCGLGLSAAANAQVPVVVNADITTSTTWTANNFYDLQAQIYVRPGATLTIEAGTVIASSIIPASSPPAGGSLAVCKGGQIFVNGTQDRPVIMTSAADVATWAPLASHPTGKNPKTGTWREACNEWGNLTLMGAAYISANNHGGATTNTPVPSASNVAPMEGLTAAFPGDTRVLYGGGNDDDDSGGLHYLSIRYGGRVIGLGNELNGLSMGGIGRNTDVDHIDIMNNVDDLVETWGGTVNYRYLNLWNTGDDGFDFDEGWRGKLQFALIVMGYSVDAAQGSGVSDHGFEMDGAEDSDWQPVSTAVIDNVTVIGQPETRGTTAWRDNNRTQFHNSIFMDNGSAQGPVRLDNVDGDGAHGYGFNGTLTWAATWTTPYTTFSTVNAPANPAAFYTAQTSGNLIEFTDCIFYNNYGVGAYTEATARGVFAPANNNIQEPALSPIQSITRGPTVIRGGKAIQPVIGLDPRPANSALTSVTLPNNDGFFSGAHYRGAFAPGCNWLAGWTASEAFGFTPTDGWSDLGGATRGASGDPVCSGTGTFAVGSTNAVSLSNAAPNALGVLCAGFTRIDFPVLGGVLIPNINTLGTVVLVTSPSGTLSVNLGPVPPGFLPNTPFFFQYLVFDPAAVQGLAFSNGLVKRTP